VKDKELNAEVVQSGTWLYDGGVEMEVWIIKQNFEFYYDEGFEDEPEPLNPQGEIFQVAYVREGRVKSVANGRQSLKEAVLYAESSISQGIRWTNQSNKVLYGGRRYSSTASFS
jgi:hypothetical protein